MITYTPSPREQSVEMIEAYILKNSLKTGDKLPTEREMSSMWELNRNTLRSALKRLSTKGVIDSSWGSGIHMSPRVTRTLQDLQSFTEYAISHGMKPASRLLSFSRTKCDAKMAMRFGIQEGDPLYRITRLRMLDDMPVLLENSFINAALVPGLEEHDLVNDSLFAVLEEAYDINIDHGTERISVTFATVEEAQHLDVQEGEPAYWLVTETFNREGVLVEYCRTIGRADVMDLSSTIFWREG